MIGSVDKLLKKTGLEKEDVECVVLVGASSRTPICKKLLREYFIEKELITDIDLEKFAIYCK